MLISEARERAGQKLLDFAWRQWNQVGVSASVSGEDRWAVDPEALILFTIGLGRWDPRLFDEMLDWIALNHGLLSMQRLRNLTARFPVAAGLVAAVIAWTREPVPVQLLKDQPTPAKKQPVFSPDVLGFIAVADPAFEEYGYLRPQVTRSGKSREPDPMAPASLAFQLRHLFGPGGRSEVMRVLLTWEQGPLDATRIADEAGFAKRNASDALTALAASGAISAAWSGNERLFTADHSQWAALLGRTELPAFVPWTHLLPAALEVICWLDTESGTTDSDYLIASHARTVMARITRDLQVAAVATPRESLPVGPSYLPAVLTTVDAMLAKLS